jgi:hypothetical protein
MNNPRQTLIVVAVFLALLFAVLPEEADSSRHSPLVTKLALYKVELVDWWRGVTTPAAATEQEPLLDSEFPAEQKDDLLSEKTDPKSIEEFLGNPFIK